MSLQPDAGAIALERAGPADLVELLPWLERDPVTNVYLVALALRDALAAPRDEYWVARREGDIVALAYLGGMSGSVLPVGTDGAALRALAERVAERLHALPRRFQVIGERAAVAPLVARLREAGREPRLERRQIYMALERGGLPPVERAPALRQARPEDHDLVFTSGAELRAEELEEDPRVADGPAYARRVVEECRDGYTWLWLEDGALRFRASLSARTVEAVQISGVYTPPECRNRGHARRGLAELCARLFERNRWACLFVNDFNAPAIAVYHRLGFRMRAEWASAFYVPPAGAE